MNTTATRDQGKFIVRMPDGMRDGLREAADASGRSMNAEIVHRLETWDDLSNDYERAGAEIDRLNHALISEQSRETHSMEQITYWLNIALALNRSRRLQLVQFKASFRHVLGYKGKIPDELFSYCEDMLKIFEQEFDNLPDDEASMNFLKKQSEEAHNLVYAAPEGEDDPDFIIDPPKK